MIRKDTTRRLLAISIASVLVLSLAAFTPVPVYAPGGSVHVAVIGTLSSTSKGDLPSTDSAFDGFTFTLLTPGSSVPTNGDFSSACLDTIANPGSPPSVACDTIALFMPTPLLGCDINSLTAQEQASIDTARSTNNLKLLIYDSECSAINYDGIIINPTLRFQTSNPGPQGAAGTSSIVEQNTLSSNADINPVTLCGDPTGDACGDANILTSQGTNLCLDMKAKNVNLSTEEPVLVYSRDLNALGGLLVYNGFDYNPASPNTPIDLTPPSVTDEGNLAQLWLNSLNQAWLPSGLLCNVPIVQRVGGDYVSLDSTALFVSSIAVNALWMLPMLAAGGIGAGVYFARGKFNKVEI